MVCRRGISLLEFCTAWGYRGTLGQSACLRGLARPSTQRSAFLNLLSKSLRLNTSSHYASTASCGGTGVGDCAWSTIALHLLRLQPMEYYRYVHMYVHMYVHVRRTYVHTSCTYTVYVPYGTYVRTVHVYLQCHVTTYQWYHGTRVRTYNIISKTKNNLKYKHSGATGTL
jgi:hypothetical protein